MSKWPPVPLGEVCAINPRLQASERPAPDTLVTFVPMAAVSEMEGAIARPEVRTYREVAKGYTAFRAGDVLFAKITPCMENGKAALANGLISGLGFGSTEFHVLRPSRQLLPEFLFFFIRQPEFRRHAKANFTGTAGQQRVPATFLQHTRIPLPPLSDQRRIVDILNRANGIRRLQGEVAKYLRGLVAPLFSKMFGNPVQNDRGWPTQPLGNLVAAIEGGKNLQAGPADGTGSLLRILKVSAVTWGEFRPHESKAAPIGYTAPEKHRVCDGDLLFTRANTAELVGATVLVRDPPKDVLLPDKIWRIVWRKDSGVLNEYALGFFQHPSTRRAMSALATGTSASMRNISQAKLRTLRVPIPPLDLQFAFAGHLRAVQGLIDRQEQSATTEHQLLQSLMTRLVVG